MPITNPDLWATIRNWPLPYEEKYDKEAVSPRLTRSFEQNLRMIGDWTDESAARITELYRQFLYLKAISEEPLTPPAAVDHAWHMHMKFSKDYSELNKEIGREIVHRTDMTKKQCEEAFARGRALWMREFDGEPSRDLWPSAGSLVRYRIGLGVSFSGFAIILIGVFVSASVGAANFWLFGIGFALFVAGAIISGNVTPATISRCG